MAFDAFDEGIIPGGLRSKSDIKLLICYILKSIGTPLDKESIIDILAETGLVNYFEAVEAFDSLLANETIKAQKDNPNLYYPTETGFLICKNLEDDLSATVKEKTYCAALLLIEQQRKEKENIVSIEKINNGYNVNCSVADKSVSLFNLNLYAPTEQQAKMIKKYFQKNADIVYKANIAVLTNNKEMLEDLLKELSENAKKKDSQEP